MPNTQETNILDSETIVRCNVTYKCQLCDTLIQVGESIEMPYNAMPNFCGKVVQNQQFAGNPYLYKAPMQIIHKCSSGSCGMAYFAGLQRVL